MAPSFSTAIQETGLKVAPGKAPLEVFVIESMEHPWENLPAGSNG
jgi:uncharacterized protein (TIGR03435 family)